MSFHKARSLDFLGSLASWPCNGKTLRYKIAIRNNAECPEANGGPSDPRPIPKALTYIVLVIRGGATKKKITLSL